IWGNVDTIYRSRITGSGNEDLIKKFYAELYRPRQTSFFGLRNSLQARKEADTNLYRRTMDSIDDLTKKYRRNIYNFYESNVKYKPYAAFAALRLSTLELMPDSTLKRYFNLLP